MNKKQPFQRKTGCRSKSTPNRLERKFRHMAKSISIVSQKGGVGKTLTAVNLAAAFSLAGQLTMLVDCDPQGSATAIAGTYRKEFEFTLEDGLLGAVDPEDILVQSSLYNLKVLPAPGPYFRQKDNLSAALQDRCLLKALLRNSAHAFDYIIIDTPAAFDVLTVNAMMAADAVVLPLQCEYLAFKNIRHTLRNVAGLKRKYKMNFGLLGILLTMVDHNSTLAGRIEQSARRHLGKWLFKTSIPDSRKLRNSPYYERPLVAKDVGAAASKRYINLAREIMDRYPS